MFSEGFPWSTSETNQSKSSESAGSVFGSDSFSRSLGARKDVQASAQKGLFPNFRRNLFSGKETWQELDARLEEEIKLLESEEEAKQCEHDVGHRSCEALHETVEALSNSQSECVERKADVHAVPLGRAMALAPSASPEEVAICVLDHEGVQEGICSNCDAGSGEPKGNVGQPRSMNSIAVSWADCMDAAAAEEEKEQQPQQQLDMESKTTLDTNVLFGIQGVVADRCVKDHGLDDRASQAVRDLEESCPDEVERLSRKLFEGRIKSKSTYATKASRLALQQVLGEQELSEQCGHWPEHAVSGEAAQENTSPVEVGDADLRSGDRTAWKSFADEKGWSGRAWQTHSWD